jgi:integrase
MARERKYKIVEDRVDSKGRPLIYAKSSYTDRQGKRHTLWRSGENRTEAKQRLKEALDKIESGGREPIERKQTTFSDLATYFENKYLVPAVYNKDVKVEGVASPEKSKSQLKSVVAFFGKMRLKQITYEDISDFKIKRLKTPYKKGKDKAGNPIIHERSLTSVHRELALVRRMLNVAVSKQWLNINPFNQGEPLISLAAEVARNRTLLKGEVGRLFEACEGDGRRAHMKTILLCLMDTGMRRNEAFRVTWKDVFFDEGYLVAVSYKGKQRMERPVPLSDRLIEALRVLKAESIGDPNARVFGVKDIKRSWATVKRLAKLENLKLHDLRHQAATNFIKSGVPLEETGKILGHREPKTTWRYLNVNKETIERAKENLDKSHKED